jgi:hypothetical protein
MMRILTIAAVLAAAGSIALTAAPPAAAQKFPPYLKSCKKDKEFERIDAEYAVPVVGGGAGVVRVVSQNYNCENKTTGGGEWHRLYGMKDASGKLVVPYAYEDVLPFSTTGAVVSEHGPTTYVSSAGYRTYIAGKGASKERLEIGDAGMLMPSNGCPPAPGEASPSSVSVVIGEDTYRGGGGKVHVTLFTPDGKLRRLESMGGDDMKRPVRRVGDVLLARWRDEQNVLRSGILDLYGRQVAPVLSNAALWVTPTTDPRRNNADACGVASLDLFIEGPSLDIDPGKPFFGPLLIPVGRDGQPVALPKGAIGMFPVYRRENQSSFSDAPRDMTSMWAVVFPKGQGFEFTLHLGAPSEALVAAETEPRYSTMARTHSFGGLVTAQYAADGKWVTFRANSDTVVGDIDADFDRSRDSALAILEGQALQRQQEVAAESARREAERIEARKRNWETARSTGRLCQLQVDSTNTREDFDAYLAACGPDNFPGFAQLALAKGIPQSDLTAAANAQAMRMMEVYKARAAWEEEARLKRMRNANKDPMASYMPGQWESAIRNAGNAAVDAINQSSDNWLQQRRDQYIADWQRSQRAY